MNSLHNRIALHTWTLDSSPLKDALRIARTAGYNAVELRHADFMHCRQAGMDEQAMVALVRDAGLKVAVVGTENGVLFDSGAELNRLLGSLRYVCEKAIALDCGVIMMPPGVFRSGVPATLPVENLAICAGITAGYGLQLALEFNSRHPTVNTLESGLALVDAVRMKNCGLLIDTYHLHRSGGSAASFVKLPVDQIVTVQFSDAPPGPPSMTPVAIDRLPPGKGTVPFVEIFKTLMALDYRGYMSYEAPNPDQWSRPADVVALEGLERVRALITQAEHPQ